MSAANDAPAKAEQDARDILSCILVGLFGFSFFAVLTGALTDGDTGWHLATGRWILEHRAIPTTDPFSYTFFNKPWTAHEWASQVAMYLVYSRAGWSGLLLMFGLIFGSVLTVVALYVRRWLRFPFVVVPVGFCFLGLLFHTLARPHLFGWLFLALWLSLLLRAREAGRAPSLWTVLLVALWANFHASFILGLALIGPLALEALVEAPADRRIRVVIDWGIFGVAALLASLLTPHGIEGLILPIMVAGMTNLSFIGEWRPTTFSSVTPFEVVLLGSIAFCLGKPVRIPLIRLLVMIGLMHLAFVHLRHQAVFVLISCLLIARPLGEAIGAGRGEVPQAPHVIGWRSRTVAPLYAVAAMLLAGVSYASFVFATVRPNSYRIPQTAVAHIPPELRNRHVFNEYSFGGTLILHGIPAFIDGRSEMYGDRFVEDYVDIARNGDLAKWHLAEKSWHIDWVIMPPDSKLVEYLDHRPGWERVYSDKWAVIQARRGLVPARRVRP